jgi:DNA repair exonuclease SbcCD ATPase subunit
MQISHLILRDFGKFDNFECDFSPGLNIIKGPNEAGKSTIVDALTAALFLDPEKLDKYKSDVKRWGGQSGPVLEALISVDGKPYKLTRDFERGKSNLDGDNVDISAGDPAAVEEWLSEKTGIPSEEIFKATACVTQGEIAHIEDSIEAIKDKLESLVTGGKEDRAGSDVLRKIDDRIVQITMDVSKTDSTIEGLDYNINKLKRDIEGLRSKRADLIQVETAYKNVCDDHAERKDRFNQAQEAQKTHDQGNELSKEHEECQSKLSRARDLHRKVEELKEQLSKIKKVTPAELREVEEAETSLGYYKRELEQAEKEAGEADEESKKFKVGIFGPGLSILGLICSGVTTTVHTLNMFPDLYPDLWYLLAGSVFMLLGGASIWNSRRQKDQMLSETAEKLSKKLEAAKERADAGKAELAGFLKKHHVSYGEEMKKNLWRYEELEKQYKEAGKEYSALMAGQSIETLEKRTEELASGLRNLTQEIGENDGVLMNPSELERERLVIHEIEERFKDLERERKVLRQQIDSAEGGSELLACYMERKTLVNNRISSLRNEVEILGITKKCIEEARQNALKSKLEVLNGTTSDILNTLTSGRYSKVRFDRSNLKFEVWADEKKDWVDPETVLSSSTIDQIYLAARLALADLVSEHKNSLFILDDPFSGYDNQRLENVMRFLKGLSGDHQILLLTSHDHYDKWADSTINL